MCWTVKPDVVLKIIIISIQFRGYGPKLQLVASSGALGIIYP